MEDKSYLVGCGLAVLALFVLVLTPPGWQPLAFVGLIALVFIWVGAIHEVDAMNERRRKEGKPEGGVGLWLVAILISIVAVIIGLLFGNAPGDF